jgi:hypothetical protein
MIFGGLIGSGGSSSAVAKLTSNPVVMVQFIPSAFVGLPSIGVIAEYIHGNIFAKNKS